MSTTFTPHFAQVPFDILKRDDINTTAKVVYSILCGFRNAVTGLCFPKYRTIGAAGSLSKGQVQAAVKHLEEASLLKHVWSEEYQCFVFELAEFVTPAEKEEKPSESAGCDKPDEGVRNFIGGGTKKSTPYKHSNKHKNKSSTATSEKEFSDVIPEKLTPKMKEDAERILASRGRTDLTMRLSEIFTRYLDFRRANGTTPSDWSADWRIWITREDGRHFVSRTNQPKNKATSNNASKQVIRDLLRKRHDDLVVSVQ